MDQKEGRETTVLRTRGDGEEITTSTPPSPPTLIFFSLFFTRIRQIFIKKKVYVDVVPTDDIYDVANKITALTNLPVELQE